MIKKMIPKKIKERLVVFHNKILLHKLYRYDKSRHTKSAVLLTKSIDKDNLRSNITYHYHSIEKGLSNPNFRYKFGKKAFTQLFSAMDKYIELGYSTEDSRFQQAISVIKSYVDLHEANDIKVDAINDKLKSYIKFDSEQNDFKGGAKAILPSELPDFSSSNFHDLAMNRFSVRDFGTKKIDDIDIEESIKLAIKSPSACNRQSSKAYYIKDKKVVNELFQLQGGLTSHGTNLQSLILVTSNRKYMNGPHERNQTYIDGGMFLMSLIYGLTYKNIATCTLNTSFYLEKEKKIRDIINLSDSEDLIAFIAVGSYPDELKVAVSPRDRVEQVLVKI